MFFSILARRAKRVMICCYRSLLKAFALTSFMTSVYLFGTGFSDKPSVHTHTVLLIMLMFFVIQLCICTVFEASNYKGSSFHRCDDDIIGTAFTGLKRSSLIFEEGLESFDKNEFRKALEVFTDLENDKYRLSQRETAVLEFYRGRCYDILGAFSNALICYESSREKGFYIPELPIFTGRCLGENGNTEKAAELFESLIRDDYIYSDRMRFEIGNIYLRANKCEEALKWFNEAIEKHERYASSLGGAALACVMLGRCDEGRALFRQALINNIPQREAFTAHFNLLLRSAEQNGSKDQ